MYNINISPIIQCARNKAILISTKNMENKIGKKVIIATPKKM